MEYLDKFFGVQPKSCSGIGDNLPRRKIASVLCHNDSIAYASSVPGA
jgi:hypothetical protein